MLDWLKNISSRFGSKRAVPLAFTAGSGIPIERLECYESYLRAGTQRLWAVWKSCDLIAKAVSSTPIGVQTAGSTKPVTDKDLLKLLASPNTEDTWTEFITRIVFHVLLTGNAYVFKGNTNLLGTKPDTLIPLNPKRVSIIPGQSGVLGYRYKANNKTVDIDRGEMIHFRNVHANNDYLGQGVIEAAQVMIENAANRQNYERGFWRNGASLSGAMINEEWQGDRAEFEKFKAHFQANYGGIENAGKTIFLNGKWRYEQFGASAQEMQDLEKTKLTVEYIFQLFGVPLSVAGARDAANYATADLDNQRFKEYTVLPLINLIIQTLQAELIDGFNQNYRLTANVSGLIPVGKVLLDYAPLFDRGGLTINEYRKLAGLPEDPDNPVYNQSFILAGYVPSELSGIADPGGLTDQAARSIVNRSYDSLGYAPRTTHADRQT